MPPTTPPKPSFTSLADIDEYYKFLVYGDPGTGKTTVLASAARKGHVVYVDAENGLKPRALKRLGIPIDNIEPYTDASYEGLEKLHQDLLVRTSKGEKIFALAWDTGTETIRRLIRQSVELGVQKAAQKGLVRSEFDVFQEDYGYVTEQMRKVLRLFHGLPMHLMIAAHVRRDTDDDGRIRKGPALTPKVAEDFRGYLDCILHLRTEEVPDSEEPERIGLSRPQGVYEAKDRYGLLPKNLVNPTADRIIDYLDERITKEKDPLQIAARQRRAGVAAAVAGITPPAANGDDKTDDKEAAKA